MTAARNKAIEAARKIVTAAEIRDTAPLIPSNILATAELAIRELCFEFGEKIARALLSPEPDPRVAGMRAHLQRRHEQMQRYFDGMSRVNQATSGVGLLLKAWLEEDKGWLSSLPESGEETIRTAHHAGPSGMLGGNPPDNGDEWSPKERAAIDELMTLQQLSERQVIRQALRHYQIKCLNAHGLYTPLPPKVPPSPESGDGWRDISTAPKDETEILGYWWRSDSHSIVWWSNSDGGTWVDTADGAAMSAPTHWKPLDKPSPPAATGGET